MKIVTIPHPSLRQAAEAVTDPADPQFQQLIKQMEHTLLNTDNPKGVGLAAPQVDHLQRIFLTALEENDRTKVISYINPQIVNHSSEQTLGPDPENPKLEGCLSMPTIYGPVPRWEWVEVEYQSLLDGDVVEKKDRFDGFHARVVQHEIDHLDGVLFTDYSLEYDLPVYREEKKELVKITDRGVLELY